MQFGVRSFFTDLSSICVAVRRLRRSTDSIQSGARLSSCGSVAGQHGAQLLLMGLLPIGRKQSCASLLIENEKYLYVCKTAHDCQETKLRDTIFAMNIRNI
jgi:hypothetical protein